MNIADSIMTTKRPAGETDDVAVAKDRDFRAAHARGLGRTKNGGKRAGRRWAERFDARNAKRATRKHRRDTIQGLQNQQSALGLARVYLGGAGNEAMRRNVENHIISLTGQLARQRHPEVFLDDTLSPEAYVRAIRAAEDEAHADIVARLQEVLDAFDAV